MTWSVNDLEGNLPHIKNALTLLLSTLIRTSLQICYPALKHAEKSTEKGGETDRIFCDREPITSTI